MWQLVERRLRRNLPPDQVAAVLGDLLEDFEQRRLEGRLGAEWWLLRECRSLVRAYRPSVTRPVAGRRFAELLSSAAGDVRIAVRFLCRHPVLTAGVIAPVALGIAASTALFTLTDSLLFRELRPIGHAAEIVVIDVDPGLATYYNRAQQHAAASALAGAPWIAERVWTQAGRLFGDDAVIGSTSIVDAAVSVSFFDTLGVRLLAGRGFFPSDLDSDMPAVVVSRSLWRSSGRTVDALPAEPVELGGRRVRVVGIAPGEFGLPGGTNVWTPATFDAPTSLVPPPLPKYARLKTGVDVEAIRSVLPQPFRIRPLAEALRPGGATAVAFLFGATTLLLLVSWLQVGALLFARAASRSAEIGVRLALGAGRVRLLRAFAAEAAVVGGTALGLAWLVAPSFLSAVVVLLPPELTGGHTVSPDSRSLLFASGMTAAGILGLALLPVDLLRRASPLALLRASGGSASAGAARGGRVRTALLLSQVTVSVALLYLAGLVTHSFLNVTSFDLGFDDGGLLIWNVPPGPPAVSPPASAGLSAMAALEAVEQARRRAQTEQHARVMSALARLHDMPGIGAASASTYVPLTTGQTVLPLSVAGRSDVGPVSARINRVSPTYFDTIGVRVSEGEPLDRAQVLIGPDVAVVNATLARRLSSAGTVIGQRVGTPGLLAGVLIVGVVPDYVDEAPDRPPDAQIFLPAPPQRGASLSTGLVRTDGDLQVARARVRAVVEEVWGDATALTLEPMRSRIARANAAWQGRAVFMVIVAVLCLPLVVAGLSGALAYDVARRARELAIRLALGADPASIRARVVGHALLVVSAGVAAGTVAGSFLGRVMETYLFAVAAVDPLTIGTVAGTLLVTAWLAALAPAWRASRTDPAGVLREG
jgi:predicted permease